MDLRHLTCLQKLYIYIYITDIVDFRNPLFCNDTKIISGGSRSQPGGIFARPEGGRVREGCPLAYVGARASPRKFWKNKAKWCNMECKPSLLHSLKLSFIFSDIAASFRAVPLPLFRTECLLWTKVVMRGCNPLPSPIPFKNFSVDPPMQSRREAAVGVREGIFLQKWGRVRESPLEKKSKMDANGAFWDRFSRLCVFISFS